MKIAAMLFRRTGNGLALLVAVLVLNFTLIHIAPGDVADTIAGDMGGADAEVMAQIRRDYGLDLPFHEQLIAYVAKLARLDLGYSFFFSRPVTELLLERLPATLLLVISAQVLAIMVGTVLGVFAARRPNGLLSHGVTIFALLGFSAPVFWTGIMLIILLCSIFPLFPVDVTVEGGWLVKTLDVLHHLFLPMLTLASIFLALYSRLARASMLDVLGTDYVRTAQAKGLSEFQVVYKHALRNALGPVVTWRACSSPASCPARCWWRRCSVGPGSAPSRSSRSPRATRRRCSASCSSPRWWSSSRTWSPIWSTASSIPASSSGTRDRADGVSTCPAKPRPSTCWKSPAPGIPSPRRPGCSSATTPRWRGSRCSS